MSSEVIDTNVLTIATGVQQGWSRPRIPLSDLRLIQKVHSWVKDFRSDPTRHLVMDGEQTILKEYSGPGNMPDFHHYGREVVSHKFLTGAVKWVLLSYIDNGSERVACLPPEVEPLVHDLGDRKMIAAAAEAETRIVNACDGDWEKEEVRRALAQMGVSVLQLLSDAERSTCRERK
jgi:hypothetical protein